MAKNKRIILFLSVFITLILLSACSKKQPEPTANNNTESIATTTNSQHLTTSDKFLELTGQDENGWNIYQSEKYGIEFKTPANWEIEKYGEGVSQNKFGDYAVINDTTKIIDNSGIIFYVTKNENNIEVNDKASFLKWKCTNPRYFDSCSAGYSKIRFEIINNKNNFIIRTTEGTGLDSETSTFYYIFKRDYVYYFTTFDFKGDNDREKLYAEIASSFRSVE